MAKTRRKAIAAKRQQDNAKRAMFIIAGITIALIVLVYFVYRNG